MAAPLLEPGSKRDKIISVRLSTAHEVITAYLSEKKIDDPWGKAHEICQELDKVSPTIVTITLENEHFDPEEFNGDDYKVTE